MRHPTLRRPVRRGKVIVLVAFLVVLLLAMVAFAVDLGYLAVVRTELQATADSCSLAAAKDIQMYGGGPEGQSVSRNTARDYGANNSAAGEPVAVDDKDVEFGYWDPTTRTFTPNREPITAVRVVARREAGNLRGAVPLFFAAVLGIESSGVRAEAIARVGENSGAVTRFLLDEDFIDTDEPAIEQLANRLGKKPEELIDDNNGDGFIDLPPGERLELRTGQVGDEGLLDIGVNEGTTRPQYPFLPGNGTGFSHRDFLFINESTSNVNDPLRFQRYELFQRMKNAGLLDPLRGVGRFNDPDRYASLVNPYVIHLSPVWKGDVSALDPVGSPTVNGVNSLGTRRGLLAFRIVGYRQDVSRSYPYLPNLIIDVVHPSLASLDLARPYPYARIGPPRLTR